MPVSPPSVIAGLRPGHHGFIASGNKTWMPGTRLTLGPTGSRTRVPGMTRPPAERHRLRLVKGPALLSRIVLNRAILWSGGPVKRFSELTEQEILALAITNEDEDSRIYRGFAQGLREKYPASAKVFDEMAEEEVRHRTMLFDLYRTKFGEYLPLIRRQDVKGFIQKKPIWLMHP